MSPQNYFFLKDTTFKKCCKPLCKGVMVVDLHQCYKCGEKQSLADFDPVSFDEVPWWNLHLLEHLKTISNPPQQQVPVNVKPIEETRGQNKNNSGVKQVEQQVHVPIEETRGQVGKTIQKFENLESRKEPSSNNPPSNNANDTKTKSDVENTSSKDVGQNKNNLGSDPVPDNNKQDSKPRETKHTGSDGKQDTPPSDTVKVDEDYVLVNINTSPEGGSKDDHQSQSQSDQQPTNLKPAEDHPLGDGGSKTTSAGSEGAKTNNETEKGSEKASSSNTTGAESMNGSDQKPKKSTTENKQKAKIVPLTK